jgi:lysozyme
VSRAIVLICLFASLVGRPAAGRDGQRGSPAAPTAQIENGIDVSRYSGSVDWAAVKRQGHTYAFVKATEGETIKDPDFDSHWSALKRAGILRGAYHFYVTRDDPAVQAAFFNSAVTFEPGDLAPVLDIETLSKGAVPDSLVADIQVWLDAVEKRSGAKPIIYTSPRFANANLKGRFGGYPLWVAEYEVPQPTVPAGWQGWHLWQWKENAPLSGVEKSADLSRANRTGIDLSTLIIRR